MVLLYGWFPLYMEAKRKISTENLVDSAGAMHDKDLEWLQQPEWKVVATKAKCDKSKFHPYFSLGSGSGWIMFFPTFLQAISIRKLKSN